MGNSASSAIVQDPRKYATEVKDGVTKDDWRRYDYVVVGGGEFIHQRLLSAPNDFSCLAVGAAGCVLAARLSEDRDVTVLLVEAGTSHGNNLFSTIPFTFVKTFHTGIDWAFQTVPQKHANNRQIDWFRGKVLGGTT
ncbi:hypothetical protein EIP86_010420 [Pleurotus ostreatoroseus]|nr:hypothetical protein EIP86_010420 [Pleurotus ostreatoroseus]